MKLSNSSYDRGVKIHVSSFSKGKNGDKKEIGESEEDSDKSVSDDKSIE